jgi:hypothetical protein
LLIATRLVGWLHEAKGGKKIHGRGHLASAGTRGHSCHCRRDECNLYRHGHAYGRERGRGDRGRTGTNGGRGCFRRFQGHQFFDDLPAMENKEKDRVELDRVSKLEKRRTSKA